MSKSWFLVPARGGSRRLPRKNLQLLGDRPLIGHVLAMLTSNWPADSIVVMTDCEEIAAVARHHGVRIFTEAKTSGMATLDAVALDACSRLLSEGASGDDLLITVQPTCPFLKAWTVREAINRLGAGAGTVLTVLDDRHLKWGLDADGKAYPLYAERLNRQDLPAEYRESGGVIAARLGDILDTGSRIGKEGVAILPVDPVQALDIDDYADFAVANYYLRRKRIVIRADGGRSLGLGHIYRALALAAELVEHDLTILTRSDGEFAMGTDLLANAPYPWRGLDDADDFLAALAELRPDAVILDVLDTDGEFMSAVRGYTGTVISFENLGPGAELADLVVNDLYVSPEGAANVLSGVRYAVLAPSFDLVAQRCVPADRVSTVLVLFGGTDPAGLTEKALAALGAAGFGGRVIVVQGPGRAGRSLSLEAWGLNGEVLDNVAFMPEVMLRADLAISSAGRTITELMTLGVPTLALCQNRLELLHTHASMPFGVMNLGLGELVDVETVKNAIRLLLEDGKLRSRMNRLMLQATEGRSNRRIVERIMQAVAMA